MNFKLQIPNPCSEEWNKMKTIPNGKHCESCQKDLIDFRTMNNRDIFDMVHSNAKICGLFSEKQLQTEFQHPKEHSFSKVGLVVSFVSLLAFINPVKAQLPLTQNQIEPNVILEQYSDISKANSDVKNDTLAIKGKVIDVNTFEPLPFAKVRVKGNRQYWVSTDFDGNFILSIPKVRFESAVVITVSYLGYQREEMLITKDSQNVEIQFGLSAYVESYHLGYIVMLPKQTKKQKFFNRFRREKKKRYTYN